MSVFPSDHPALRRCLLCKAPSTIHALFEPNDQETWGARPGKVRRIAYALCDPCFERADLVDAVEKNLLERRTGGAA